MKEQLNPSIYIHLLTGGIMPKRQTDGAIGYDAHIRAVVCDTHMDPDNPILRKTLFDFNKIPDDPKVARHCINVPADNGRNTKLVYRMDPHESVLVGIGFVTAMPFPMFYWVAPRGGLSSRWGITVTNAPGTVDPDYRGEAGVLVYNRNDHPFDLEYGMRIAQIIFQRALIPKFNDVKKYDELPKTTRGTGGFGSTGLT